MVNNTHSSRRTHRGVTLVEVLVTLVILTVGLLGLVALQARVQVLQAEAYQRAQALMLLRDMASRIANNRNDAEEYVTGAEDPLGVGAACPGAGASRRESDQAEWCAALQGASETLGGGNVGAMVGGRGCIENVGPGEYLVTVAWQGLAPIAAPPASVACGTGLYEGDGEGPCTGDLCRRAVTTVVIIPSLT
jgi:type IV pilus assembly protein PilV